ncbi:MAG: hypothetical protein U0Q15_14265 [Kineosporiaceae bacterium]
MTSALSAVRVALGTSALAAALIVDVAAILGGHPPNPLPQLVAFSAPAAALALSVAAVAVLLRRTATALLAAVLALPTLAVSAPRCGGPGRAPPRRARRRPGTAARSS